jgi:DNA-binding transcriptional regulator YhcF (GntR family)
MAEPPYLRIVADIQRRIASGQLRPGDRVPSTRQLARDWDVALATATKALTALAQEGLVEAVPRAGTVVAAPRPRVAARRSDGDVELSRDRIVRAAIDVADAEGLPAVSMRRVAAELGVATMSLYRHVPGKDELVLLMAETVFGEAPPPDPPPAGWRARLEGLARLQWTLCRRHPWLARTISLTRPMPVPNGMAHTEYSMQALDGLGLDRATMMRVAITLAGHLQAIAMNLESEVEAEQNTGMTSDEWMAATYPDDGGVMASGRFPLLASLAQEPDADLGLDELFEAGLALLLDGVEVLVRGPRWTEST